MKNLAFTLLIALLLPLAGIAQVENTRINPINASIEDLMKLVPEGLTLIPDIAYNEGSDAWKLDLVMPENLGDVPRPALVFVHGGGWRNGDKRNWNFFMPCIDFALKGYVCITINYRLLGEADGIDDCIADVKCAVRWLRANAEKYNIDPERFGAYGNSAGAHLVSILGLCPKSAGMEGDGPYQEYSSMVQAVVSSATPASFMIPMSERARKAQEQPQNQQQQSTEQQNSRPRRDIPDEMKSKISPITYVNADAPPFILVHDVSDATVGVFQSDEFAKALKEAGAKDVTYKRYDNESGHGVFFKNIEETGPMREAFFDRVLMKGKIDKKDIAEGLKSHDRALYIKEGWIRDPYIYLAPDGYYYLTGTQPNPDDPREAVEPYNTGLDIPELTGSDKPSIVGSALRVWRSKDLITWENMGVPFTMDQGYWAGIYPEKFKDVPLEEWRLWAPEVYFYDGKWMFVHTSPSPVGGGANLAITQDESFKGPFSHPMKDEMRNRHDPSLFQDEDGIFYLLWGNTSVVPLKEGFAGTAGDPVRIDPSNTRPGPNGDPIRRIGHEGATIRLIGDKYVHLGTAWSTDRGRKGTYNLYYCTADKITGPYGPRQFAGRFLGHGTPFQDKEGRWWCTAFFNANVPPISHEESMKPSVEENAYTINEQGVTIVPLDVRVLENGKIYIRAKDPAYAVPGPEEVQDFGI